MGDTTSIAWTHKTFNSHIGCTFVCEECIHCYAKDQDDFRFSKTLGKATKENPISHWGPGALRHRTSESNWKQPLKWNKEAAGLGIRYRVFACSLSDWLDDEIPIEWFRDFLFLIYSTPHLDWQLLTKRPQNWKRRAQDVWEREGAPSLFAAWVGDWIFYNRPPANVWIGVSQGVDQAASLAIPAVIHFLSCEPMLKPLDKRHAAKFDQIIFGGESGKKARRCEVSWIRDGLNFCKLNGIAAFNKQLGAHVISRNDDGFEGDDPKAWPMDTDFTELDTGYQGAPVRINLKDSHGGDMAEWPADLRVRQFPEGKKCG